MTQQLIQSKGIYHGLPVYPESQEGLTAIVTGANGISGDHMLRVLCEAPKRWSKIYALSRRPPHGTWPSHVEHVSMDMLQAPEKIAEQMEKKGVQGDYVFFFAYVQPTPPEGGNIWSAIDELVKINTALLSNFLKGLELNHTIPKRVLLQLGAKYYGVHIGPAPTPQEEEDPRVHIEPNFYYTQEDCLKEFAKKHSIGWNSTLPSNIAGAVPDAAMNFCFPLAIYASIQKYLNRPLEFPSDLKAWETTQTISSAQMNAYISEYVVLTDRAKNQIFNTTDDCAFTWGKTWPKVAARFNMPWTGPDTSGDAQFYTISFPKDPPRGFGPKGAVSFKFSLTEWAKRPEVQKAWDELAQKYNLKKTDVKDIERVFGFLDFVLAMTHSIYLSNSNLRKIGFFGFVDSVESIFEAMQGFVDLNMVPPLP